MKFSSRILSSLLLSTGIVSTLSLSESKNVGLEDILLPSTPTGVKPVYTTRKPTTKAPTRKPTTTMPTTYPTTKPTTLQPLSTKPTNYPTNTKPSTTPTFNPTSTKLPTTKPPIINNPTFPSRPVYPSKGGPGIPPSRPTFRPAPVQSTCPCKTIAKIPTECEVNLLIKMLDLAVSIESMLAAMFLRLSFHDSGTFDQTVSEGGANGCLMTDATMLMQEENNGLDTAIETLKVIKLHWEEHPMTCVDTSNADFIQFAGLFAAVRQLDIPGMTSTKMTQLLGFQWGREDEPNCDIEWTLNLPRFDLNDDEDADIPSRCLLAGGEIKTKMMDKNGFTSEEATALIGAHTIGLTREIFGHDHAAPWVASGADNATVDGPVFDNKFFDFLENTIVEDTADAFDGNIAPFTFQLATWFQTEPTLSSPKLNHLDTDIVLAFPTQDASVYPNYHDHTTVFANNNNYFLDTFFKALDKMSKLGVINVLSNPNPLCPQGCVIFGLDFSQEILELDLRLAISTAEKQLELKQESRNQEELKKLTTPVHQFILSEDNKVAVPVDDALFKV